MERYTIEQYAERKAREAAAAIANDRLARSVYQKECAAQIAALGRAVATGERPAWELADGMEYRQVASDNPLLQELRRWLSGECFETRQKVIRGAGSDEWLSRDSVVGYQKIAVPVNHTWMNRLFVADAMPGESVQWGSSGTAFDQVVLFTLNEAARALALSDESKNAAKDWLPVLQEAMNAPSGALEVSIFDEDKDRTIYIQRQHFRKWCESRRMYPTFLFASTPDAPPVDAGSTSSSGADNDGRRAQQINGILVAVAASGYDAQAIPDGGKAAVKKACKAALPSLFTDSSFDHAWKAASKTGKVAMANKEKYNSGGGQ